MRRVACSGQETGAIVDIILFYGLAVAGVVWSYTKSRQKTRQALKKSWKSFENILPSFAFIMLLIGTSLALISPLAVSKLLGTQSGWAGLCMAAAIGSITLIPGFIAFPLARAVLEMGAGMMQVAVFVSTLMMVGVVTAPMEIQFFNRKTMLLRNGMSVLYSFAVAYVLAKVAG